MRAVTLLLIVFAWVVTGAPARAAEPTAVAAPASGAPSTAIHELRIYHCMPGRLPDLHKRFETVTLKIWEKHNIRPIAFWTVVVGDSNQDLYYVLEWNSMAEREQAWTAFATDPEWIEKRIESEKNGPIIERVSNLFLQPTRYSKIR
ncbi:MAG: NIPSNAP family protein [Burkholderiales bacterium]|nr:NIPSNAP family protein [Burkholderiales bacterium]